MDGTRFDGIAKRLASRRLSRRRALQQGGLGLAAGAAATRLPGAAAQDATPGATPEAAESGRPIEFLFVQSFAQGSIEATESEGTYSLTLDHALGQTLYVSNRPERIVGMAPTEDFLAGFSFGADNPPNAALVMETAAGDTSIAMVELMNPVYDSDAQQLTYQAVSLAQWSADFEDGEYLEASGLGDLAPEFSHAHLVIDDCGDGYVACRPPGTEERIIPPGFPQAMGYCWSWSSFQCLPCEPSYFGEPDRIGKLANYWRSACEAQVPDRCGGQVCDICWRSGPFEACF